jgi:dTDP-4-dehydrorhamnose 3,5-epimerase
MKFAGTKIEGVFEIRIEPHCDQRGYFARTWCREEFERHHLNPNLAQCSVSFNVAKGTLRGLHFQGAPYQESKLVRCTRGAVYDVAVDLRPASPTFRMWTAATLTAENGCALYVPEGCGHGFITLEDNTEIFYQISEFYHESAAGGVRWNDPAFGIAWPEEVRVISERDRSYPDFPNIGNQAQN